jgi:cyclophilin family peptidyl-prolyl cis-trans isomerase
MHALEARTYFAAPALDEIPAQTVPAGKTIQVPLTASDADGNTLHYTVTSDNPNATVELHPVTNTWLRLSTTQGVMLFQLFNDYAPNTVATMSGLVNAGYFNGLKFYRITNDPKAIYGGSPTNDLSGGPGFRYDDEFNPDALFTNGGVLAMLNSGKDNNGSQFFITAAPARPADFNYTAWGQLVRGADVLNNFFGVPVSTNGVPGVGQKIRSAAIVTDTTDAVAVVKGAGIGTAHVSVTCDDGAGASTTDDFDVSVEPDQFNEPPILTDVADTVAPKNKPISIKVGSIDLEGDASEYAVDLVGDPLQGSTSLQDDVVTFTPRKNFTGPVRLFVGVRAPGALARGYVKNAYDTQQIQIGVGDLPATGSAVSIDAVAGQTIPASALAVFRDSDPLGKPSDWDAIARRDQLGDRAGGVNWGDDTITDGAIVRNHHESYSVTGSHAYPAAGTYPITVVVEGNLGARLTLRGSATVRSFASMDGSTLVVNGTSADDVIAVSMKDGFYNVSINGTLKRYAPEGITRVNVLAFDGDDRVTLGAGVPGSYVDGGRGNDSIDGGDGKDTLTGGAGKNTLNGNGGNDRLNGSGGRDLLNGGEGNDFLYGNGGNDTLDGGSGSDHLFADLGDDLLIGGGGNDKLFGDDGSDTLLGGKGTDLQDGGAGADSAQQDGTDVLTSIEATL